MIDSRQAAAALSDIDDIVRRVRQSRIYNLSALLMIWWGAVVFAANAATWLWPRHGNTIWLAVDVIGVAGSIALSFSGHSATGRRSFNARMLIAYLMFFAFGYFTCNVLGHFGPRQLGTFWPIYFMMFYSLAGLWFGYAFVAIGLGISALTLVGYYFIGEAFPLWMAFVNGGGLMLGGLWMRRS